MVRRSGGGDDRLAGRPARGQARRGDEGGAGAFDDRVPRPRPRPGRVSAAAAGLAARQRPGGRVEADARGARDRVGRGSQAGACRDRSRPRSGGEHRPGSSWPLTGGRRARGQGPVPGDRRGGRVRHAQPAPALPRVPPADARARCQGGARRARPAGDRGVRLRARGRQPPPDRPLLARPSIRARARRRHRAQPPPRPGHRGGSMGSASSGSPSSPTRSATATPRSSTASSMPTRASSTSPSAIPARVTTCCATTSGSRSSTSG